MPPLRLALSAPATLARARATLARLACVALTFGVGCSTALSPYAADDSASERAGDAGPAREPAPDGVALFAPDLPLPTCDIDNLSDDCPDVPTILVSEGRNLPCRRDQLGARCAYPSPEGSANLLECVLEDSRSPRWQFRRERCRRSCFGEIPTSFTPLSNLACLERPLTPCDWAGTAQTSVDEALKEVARSCGGGSPRVYGLLLDENGCGRALFLQEAGLVAKCISDTLAGMRFGCPIRCASSFEPGDSLRE